MSQPLRVFLASPRDVAYERTLVRRLLKDELPYDPLLRGRVTFEVVSWDDPLAPTPMVASLTPQEAVTRFGCRPSECDIIIVILWSRIGTHLDISKFQKPNGEPYLSGTEYEYEDAASAEEPPTILVYRRMARVLIDADDPQHDAEMKQRRNAQAFFDRFKNPDGSYRGGFTDYAEPTDFVSRLEKDLKTILRKRLDSAPSASQAIVGKTVWTGSPYPGLRPFTTQEAPIFFGRGRELDGLIARLHDPAQRFLAVVGASGTGKSSLIRAGLIPRLKGGALEGSQDWHVLPFTPGAEIAKALTQDPQSVAKYVAILLAERPSSAELILFVDQLEELFTLVDKENRAVFATLLAHAAGHPRVRVLATLRTDFSPQGMAEPKLAGLLQLGTFQLGPPEPGALAAMIQKPAERAGLELEDGLADEIIKDAGSDPPLPLVAFCLEQLYRQAAPGRRLTLAAYEDLDRLRGAISRRAATLLEDLRQTKGATLDTVLPQLFRALVHVDAAGTATRQRAFRDELGMPQLLASLVDGRLLVAEELHGRATVMLAHDVVLQVWPALHEWLRKVRGERLYPQMIETTEKVFHRWHKRLKHICPNAFDEFTQPKGGNDYHDLAIAIWYILSKIYESKGSKIARTSLYESLSSLHYDGTIIRMYLNAIEKAGAIRETSGHFEISDKAREAVEGQIEDYITSFSMIIKA